MVSRSETRPVQVGNVTVGGGAPVSVQTMLNADPHDVSALLAQLRESAECGAELIRLTVPDQEAARVFGEVRKLSPVPLIADIHFDFRLALVAIEAGADALRINPGNIGGADRVRQVVMAAQKKRVPIRIGVNGGSLEKDIFARYGSATPEALVESVARHVALLEAQDFHDIVISAKASDVPRTIAVYRLLAERFPYPLHLGVTEAGTFLPGTVRSCVALGVLLSEGIGDTIRVSLTDRPVQEVRVGIELLRAAGLRAPGASVTSCPTCGRTQVDVAGVAEGIQTRLEKFYREHPDAPRPHIAVMGCVVNGPGEAKNADLAVAGGKDCWALYVRGNWVRNIPADAAIETICSMVESGCAGS